MSGIVRGQFLIAKPHLRDSNFFKAAVLMVEHNEEGAMGLVINRPSSDTVAKALNGHMEIDDCESLVYYGGPVEPAALFILHNAGFLDPGEQTVCDDILVGSSAEVFEQVVRAACDADSVRFRVYAGCAGWGPKQLEGELERGDWFVHPASEDLVFHDDPYVIWETLVMAVQQSHRILPHRTDNPEWN
jgi:putative transcriptional regulator